MSSKAEAPPPRDIAQEGRDTLQTQISLAPQQFAAESQYAPQYAQLYQDILNQSLFGQGGILQSYEASTPRLGQIQAQANTQQRLADIGDVEQYGGRAVEAFNQANPQLAALRGQIAQNAQGGGGISSMSAPMSSAALNSFSASPYERVTAGPNAAADAYSQRAISDLSLGGSLGRQESRDLTNDVLARFSRAGRVNDPSAIAATALELDQAQNARLQQRQAAAAQAAGLTQNVNALGLQAGMSNQGAGLQQQGYTLQSALANQSAQQQTNLANQDMSYRSALANQQAELANEQLRQQRLMQAAGFLQSSQIDPFQAILGRSGSLQGAMGAAQQGGASAGYGGTGMFDPFSAYGSDLYNTNYNAQAAANNATANNRAGMIGSGIGAIGTIAGAKLMFMCIPEGEFIDTPNGRKKIEEIRSGDSVTGYNGDSVNVIIKHEYRENPDAVRFLRFRNETGTFAVCDMHRIEGVRSASYEGAELVERFGGVVRSYDLLTEDQGYRMAGVPVNSMIEEMAASAAGVQHGL